jgi:hypothetical protein
MKLRYGPIAALLAALVMLTSGSVRGATTVSSMELGSSAQVRGTHVAQTAPSVEPSRGVIAPPRATSGTVTTNFNCSDKTCNCKGGSDCFDLGAKDLCGSWNCTGDACSCTKKAK